MTIATRPRRAGEYELDELIGEGAFGHVYRAHHPVIGKKAAVKVLREQFSTDPGFVKRFIDEARAVNQIRNRHIVDIFSFGQLDNGQHYIVMEWLDGMTLKDYLAKHSRMPLDVALEVFSGVARALDAAHAVSIVHRDLKPANIFLTFLEDGTCFAKLLDFGVAKLLGEPSSEGATITGTPVGTPAYMSPEQAYGHSIDHRSDLYCLGVVVHHALTGKRLFSAPTTLELMMKHATEPPPAMSSVSDLPALLDQPVLRMLQKNPADRPSSARAAMDALAAAASSADKTVRLAEDSLPATQSMPTLVERPAQVDPTLPLTVAPRRVPSLLFLVVVAAIALAVGAAMYSVRSHDAAVQSSSPVEWRGVAPITSKATTTAQPAENSRTPSSTAP
ncbi:MAG: serine/threonine-protein kinase [Polyangiaceae bacterium]